MATKEKNFWVLLLFLLSGLVLGGLLGELAKSVDWLWWLAYGKEFGYTNELFYGLGKSAAIASRKELAAI